MKRVMILVLPTDWSPKNTSLYLAKADTGAIFVPDQRNMPCIEKTGASVALSCNTMPSPINVQEGNIFILLGDFISHILILVLDLLHNILTPNFLYCPCFCFYFSFKPPILLQFCFCIHIQLHPMHLFNHPPPTTSLVGSDDATGPPPPRQFR